MTGRYAAELADKACKWLAENGPSSDIRRRTDRPIGDGNTRIGPNRHISMYAGVAEIKNEPDREFRDGEALLPFVALFHEAAGHGMQLTDEFSRKRTLSKVLFLSQCACKGSAQYYGVADNGVPGPMYFEHPHEIAAQYMGIKCAHQYLSYAVGPEKAESLMMDYVAYRRELGCEFLPDSAECGTVKDVLKAMNDGFRKKIEAHRDFKPDYDPVDALGAADHRRPKADLLAMVRGCGNGLRQDGIMATAFFENMRYLTPDDVDFLENTETGRAMELGVAKMFMGKGCPIWPPPTGFASNLDRLKAVTEKLDNDTGPEAAHDTEYQ